MRQEDCTRRARRSVRLSCGRHNATGSVWLVEAFDGGESAPALALASTSDTVVALARFEHAVLMRAARGTADLSHAWTRVARAR